MIVVNNYKISDKKVKAELAKLNFTDEDLRNTIALYDDSIIELSEIREYADYLHLLNNKHITLPLPVIKSFNNFEEINKFVKNTTFKFFKNEIGFDIFNKCERPTEMSEFVAFAYCLGCFSKEKLTDKNGNLTDVCVAQKACSFLKYLLDNEYIILTPKHAINYDYILNIFKGEIDFYKTQPNIDFLKFITHYEKKSYPNLLMVLNIEKKIMGVFQKIMLNFDTLKKYRTTISEKGTPTTVPWETAIYNFLSEKIYTQVTEGTKDIAKEFTHHNLDDQTFFLAKKYRQSQMANNIPHHILNKPLKEETILDTVERLKLSIDDKLSHSEELIDEVYQKAFTYEFLDKYDPKNFVIGLYASCCATISGRFYGAEIAKRTVTSRDVQNLVIRDINNEIIAKGAAYVSKNPSYMIFNDFEINEKYRRDEASDSWGYYTSGMGSEESKTREKIFQAFLRGIKQFVTNYDLEHPNDPIRKVVVGAGINRLNAYCIGFPKLTFLLSVPKEYKFLDAQDGQYLIYSRGNKFCNNYLEHMINKKITKVSEDDNEIK